jgi:hypothetical protein
MGNYIVNVTGKNNLHQPKNDNEFIIKGIDRLGIKR